MFKKLREKMQNIDDRITFPVQWGGYYTYQEKDGKYHAWRLLDFNVHALHYRPLDGTFDHRPSLDEVKALQAIMHIPQQAAVLLRQKDLTLLGGDPLDKKALEGYSLYLMDAHGYSQDEVDDLAVKLISFSHEQPGLITLKRNPEDPGSLTQA